MFKFLLIAALVAFVSADVHELNHIAEAKVASDVRADGFDTTQEISNGIRSQASGDAHGNIHGNFEWVSPEGVHVKVDYVANENGYQPASDLLPTPPPIPAAIVRSLEWIATHPSKETIVPVYQPVHH